MNNLKKRHSEPTAVLYLKNIPSTMPEEDIIRACSLFGNVSNTLFMRDKYYAFVQFENVESAKKCLNYYQAQPWHVSNKGNDTIIEFNYSGREQITKNERGGVGKQIPNRILLLTILHKVYPVTTHVLNQIFEKYGLIRCILYERPIGLQALVELQDVKQAMAAKQNLDMQFIYSGCNQLRIQYSNQNELIVRQNDEKSADFTLPSAKQLTLHAHTHATIQYYQQMAHAQAQNNMMQNYGYPNNTVPYPHSS